MSKEIGSIGAAKCSYCNQPYDKCNKIISQSSLKSLLDDEDNQTIKCPFCSRSHSISFDNKHCGLLKQGYVAFRIHLDFFEKLLNDPKRSFIHLELDALKAKLNEKADNIRQLLNALNHDLNESLDDYESNCLKSIPNVTECYRDDLNFFKSKLQKIDDALADKKQRESKSESIKKSLDLLNRSIESKTKSLKNALLFDRRFQMSTNLANLGGKSEFLKKINEINGREIDECRYLEKSFFYLPCGHSFCDKCCFNNDLTKYCTICDSERNAIFNDYCLSDLIREINFYFNDSTSTLDLNVSLSIYFYSRSNLCC